MKKTKTLQELEKDYADIIREDYDGYGLFCGVVPSALAIADNGEEEHLARNFALALGCASALVMLGLPNLLFESGDVQEIKQALAEECSVPTEDCEELAQTCLEVYDLYFGIDRNPDALHGRKPITMKPINWDEVERGE